MKNGLIDKLNEKAWNIVHEISRFGLTTFKPSNEDFNGFYLVASLSSISPKYMYEKLFEIFDQIAAKDFTIKASTIIQQPLAVAIAHKETTCVVVESGHGNTQVCPISRYPIRNAIVAINRGDRAVLASRGPASPGMLWRVEWRCGFREPGRRPFVRSPQVSRLAARALRPFFFR